MRGVAINKRKLARGKLKRGTGNTKDGEEKLRYRTILNQCGVHGTPYCDKEVRPSRTGIEGRDQPLSVVQSFQNRPCDTPSIDSKCPISGNLMACRPYPKGVPNVFHPFAKT
eukprot:1144160-Pelagomonas_calceolata.AAC.5